MNNKIKINQEEAFYATVLFSVQSKIVMVKHHKGSVVKIPGGTYSGSRRKWEERGEGADYYNNFSLISIKEKIIAVIKKMLGDNLGFIPDNEIDSHASALVEAYGNNPAQICACIELIEETGLIPFELNLFHRQVRGIQQFFFTCESAFAFSRDQQKFISVKTVLDIPQDKHDFDCQDADIEEILVMDFGQLDSKEINFAHSHRESLRNFLMKNIAESRL